MTITLTVRREFLGEQHFEFEDDVTEIDLRQKDIVSIDLSPLSTCTHIQELQLNSNKLHTIDLAPLSSCPDFQSLELPGNKLTNIDLNPLSSCANLRTLYLANIQLTNINLAPLSSCTHLEWLHLGDNQLQNIDLTPLSSCSNLYSLNLSSNQFQHIDLTPLSACLALKDLILYKNHLTNIDLTPLNSCPNLSQLSLWGNRLQGIDLEPLSQCAALIKLDLKRNHLQSINLSPLSTCVNLWELSLDTNELKSIDLTPLSYCVEYQQLNLRENQFKNVDISPLFMNTGIMLAGIKEVSSWLRPIAIAIPHGPHQSTYSRPTRLYPWFLLYRAAKQFMNDYRVQHDILTILGLEEYGFIDCDLTDVLLSMSPETRLEDVREILTRDIVVQIAKAAEKNKATTGLRIEELVTTHSEIAAYAQHIIELRKKEIEKVRITIVDDKVDLRELWLTSYGFNVLSALNMRTSTDSTGLVHIRNAFDELGYDLKIGNSSISGVKMSNELKECIWWVVENRGKKWIEIVKI